MAGAFVVAALSLLWQAAPTTDPWGWIVWGREVAQLDLDTSGGGAPSWKPLPVLITTPLSLFGDAAPELWLVISRAGGLLALALAYRLASRLAGRTAGVLAAILLLFSQGWLQGYLNGYLEPAVIALLLGAIECHLSAKGRAALVLLFLAGLARPEVWPCFGLYALWRARDQADERFLVAGLLAATPLLWFGGDLWGSGNPLHGGEVARAVSEHWGRSGIGTLLLAFSGLEIAMVVLAVAGFLLAPERDRTLSLLAFGSLAWFTMLIVLVTLGYPASPRFMATPVAGLCVLAAIGVVRLWHAAPDLRSRPIAMAGLAVLVAVLVIPRVGATAATAAGARARADVQADLRVAVRHVGRERLLECGTPVLREDVDWNEGALAWELDLPLARVQVLTPAEAMQLADKEAVVVHAASTAPTRAASLARTRLWTVARFSPKESADMGCGRRGLQLASARLP